jgi:hydrogenase maturation factor HypE
MGRIELSARVFGPTDPQSCDFYFWTKLKNVVYANNPHDLEALKQNIREAIYNIQQRQLQQVS